MSRFAFALLLFCCACSRQETPQPYTTDAPSQLGKLAYEDKTQSSGLRFAHDAGLSPEKQLPETMGAGAALADFNEDGVLDIYFVQSGPLPLHADRSSAPTNELWLGKGDGTFRNATAESGDAAHRGYGMGVACGDYNGDGHLDLYVTNLGADVLLAGDGTGRFTDRTQAARISDERWTAGATFFDADGDGDLDLYVTAYLDYDLADPQFCGERKPGWRSYCHPDQYAGLQDRFWRNRGDGTFEDATLSAGLSDSAGKGLGVCASDFDGDGDLDLYVANDSVENRMWINTGAGLFEDGTLLAGTGVNGQGMSEAGMGLATGDLNEDGRLDLYVTNFDSESNTLYRNDGGGFFSDVTDSTGLEAATRLFVGFGTIAADLDDDGDLDLAVVNGHIIDNIHLYNDGQSWAQKAQLFENNGVGHFRDVSDASGDFSAPARVGRGLYAGDLDGDGDLDLVLTENNGPARVMLRVGSAPQALELHGLPLGTRVVFELADGREVLREAGPQVSYFGSSAPSARFAAGAVRAIEVLLPGGRRARTAPTHDDTNLAPGRYRARLTTEHLELRSF